MLFGRVKSLEAILKTAEKKSLKRSLGPFQLIMLGIGAVIGTGIFVLTSEAAQKAGPAMMLSFIIAGFVCAVAALCYSELASMVPVAGSAYTYTYAVMGEMLAWMVGWALSLEYGLGAAAVAAGWSGYFVGLMKASLGWNIPLWLSVGPSQGGIINLPAVVVSVFITGLLILGTTESARFNAVLVAVKVAALTLFVFLTWPLAKAGNFHPFIPNGWGTVGVVGAAASIFFAYVGFDAVSTAAEETRNPQRNVPIGLIGSLIICTVFYILVSGGAVGAMGAQPVRGLAGEILSPGSTELAQRCAAIVAGGAIQPLVCSHEALAHVRTVGYVQIGNLLGLAAFIALPSVVLMMMYGQTRVFFVMARDGLLPPALAKVHPKFRTPYVVTAATGGLVVFMSAFLPVGKLADYSNSGTLFAFAMVAISVMVLRKKDPDRKRPFRTPFVYVVAPVAIIGCIILYIKLPPIAMLVLPGWGAVGLLIYFLYGRSHSYVGRGIIDPEEQDDPPIHGVKM